MRTFAGIALALGVTLSASPVFADRYIHILEAGKARAIIHVTNRVPCKIYSPSHAYVAEPGDVIEVMSLDEFRVLRRSVVDSRGRVRPDEWNKR